MRLARRDAAAPLAFRPSLWRTTTFRLTAAYGAGFAIGIVLLLSLIYVDVAGYMTRQMDQIVLGQAEALSSASAEALPERIRQVEAEDVRHVNYYGLFSKNGEWITGNVRQLPQGLILDGRPRELRQPGFRPGARALAETLPWGEVLFVGFDAKTLSGLQHIIVNALIWIGSGIIVVGLAFGAAFSLGPLSRINAVQEASLSVMHGDLGARLPVLGRGDEIDLLAAIANAMMDEVERLLGEVKTVGDNVAHDLRTPLTRLRAGLYRVQQEHLGDRAHQLLLDQALIDTDALLSRFKALQRIGEIDRLARQAGFAQVCLADLIEEVAALFTPVAEDHGLTLKTEISSDQEIFADRELLFELLVNLVGNAVKFTPEDGAVLLRVAQRPEGPQLQIIDSGPGVPPEERDAVMQRFYRGRRDRETPGSGLGLSIVAAVARLHGYRVSLSDAAPGLVVTLDCWPLLINATEDAATQKRWNLFRELR
jgi:signal transduction histidine kinase